MKTVAEGSPTLKERQFLEMLKNVFIGARIEGQGRLVHRQKGRFYVKKVG